MRTLATLLVAALVLVTGIVPRHRCTAHGREGPTTVFLGAHAHEGQCEHGCDGHDGDDGDEGEPAHPPCCTDDPADPTAPPTRGDVVLDLPPVASLAVVADDAVALVAVPRSAWHVPIPRPPTETVVLLR